MHRAGWKWHRVGPLLCKRGHARIHRLGECEHHGLGRGGPAARWVVIARFHLSFRVVATLLEEHVVQGLVSRILTRGPVGALGARGLPVHPRGALRRGLRRGQRLRRRSLQRRSLGRS